MKTLVRSIMAAVMVSTSVVSISTSADQVDDALDAALNIGSKAMDAAQSYIESATDTDFVELTFLEALLASTKQTLEADQLLGIRGRGNNTGTIALAVPFALVATRINTVISKNVLYPLADKLFRGPAVRAAKIEIARLRRTIATSVNSAEITAANQALATIRAAKPGRILGALRKISKTTVVLGFIAAEVMILEETVYLSMDKADAIAMISNIEARIAELKVQLNAKQ